MRLLEKVFSADNLNNAWLALKVKSRTGGIDGVSVEEFARDIINNIKELNTLLCAEKYIPEPYKRVYIEKNETEYRPLSLLAIKDKIVQLCFLNYFRENIEKQFADTSYAYRMHKGHKNAINRINDFLIRGNIWVCALDIDDFFDNIDRAILLDKCSKLFPDSSVIRLIEMWVKTGVVYKSKYSSSNKGIAQGGVISPFLSNIYLDCYDKGMKEMKYDNVRYADNILLMSKETASLSNSLNYTKNYLADALHLRLNKIEKEAINTKFEDFAFCGILFTKGKKIITAKKIDKIKRETEDIINSEQIDLAVKQLNLHTDGIKRYYSFFDINGQFNEIDAFLIDRLAEKYNWLLLNGNKEEQIKFKKEIKNIEFLNSYNAAALNAKINNAVNKPLSVQKLRTPLSPEKAVQSKKRQYQKYWFENLDVLIAAPFSNIGKSAANIVIRKDGKIKNEIAAGKLNSIIISSKAVTISSEAVKLCTDNNISVNFVDDLGRPYASIISASGGLSPAAIKQIEILGGIKAKIAARAIVAAKIKNQLSLVKYFSKNKTLFKTDSVFNNELQTIVGCSLKADETGLNIELDELRGKLMGIEGSAAAAYWKLFKMLIPSAYSFEEREHQNARNIVNIMLNYAYGILYTRVLGAVTLCGLNPNVSCLHTAQNKKPVLVFDLIEIFRAPVADRTVIAILQKGIKVKATNGLLADETKSLLAKKILLRLNTEFIRNKKNTSYNKIIIEQVRQFADFIMDKEKKFKTFLAKW